MKYACNISNQLLDILDENNAFCDYIKVGGFGNTLGHLDGFHNYRPLILHGFGWFERAGMKDLSKVDFGLMNNMISQYETPFIGVHILAYPEDVRNMSREEMIENMVNTLLEFRDNIHCPVIIENMDYSTHYTYPVTVRESVEPEFINEILERTGMELLLDTSHAKVSAYQLGISYLDYLNSLPLNKVKEIHFSGAKFTKKEGYLDFHGIMEHDDLEVAIWIKSNIDSYKDSSLELITLEYGRYGTMDKPITDKAAIEKQMKFLKKTFN